jgi:dipeptidyl aminopeptidase/acylaminoacyl peptidase
MKKRAAELQAPVEILIVKNSGHNWRKVGAEIEPSREEIIRESLAFFHRHALE